MYNTGWAKSRRALDCFLIFTEEILGGYWQILDRSGKKIILISPLRITRRNLKNEDTAKSDCFCDFFFFLKRGCECYFILINVVPAWKKVANLLTRLYFTVWKCWMTTECMEANVSPNIHQNSVYKLELAIKVLMACVCFLCNNNVLQKRKISLAFNTQTICDYDVRPSRV